MEVFEYLREMEVKQRVKGDYLKQHPSGVSSEMRGKVVDWQSDVSLSLGLLPDTLFLAVNVLDRFLERDKKIRARDLQLAGATALLLSCKFEEIFSPEINELVFLSAEAFTKEAVLKMEYKMLGCLGWCLASPTPFSFLRRFSKAARSDSKSHSLSKYLLEISLPASESLLFLPSLLAASAVYLARRMLSRVPYWDETMVHYTRYDEPEVRKASHLMNNIHSGHIQKEKKNSIFIKYSQSQHFSVSLIPSLS